MAGLNVICLISGGKDSLFSILHCLRNGHHIVALANLHPPHLGKDTLEDVDSYMYQTIGHNVLPLYEQALGLPLYRQQISGTARVVDKCYAPVNDSGHGADETEDLLPLLTKIQAEHPGVNAVSTGAILSDYQRTRVESVALRLGLVPLSYLWQWPRIEAHSPTALLEDMALIGQDSRIVKVASGGLDESFLWQNLADPRTRARLVKTAQRFGTLENGAVLGEGGEYETLAIAGPPPLWKGRIVVKEDDRIITTGEAGVASVRLTAAAFEPFQNNSPAPCLPPAPSLFEDIFAELFFNLANDHNGKFTENAEVVTIEEISSKKPSESRTSSIEHHSLCLESLVGDGINAAEQMQSIMSNLAVQLQDSGQTFADIAYTSIILASMADFPSINKVYGSYFTKPNPPARVTVACSSILPPTKLLMLSTTSFPPSTNLRSGLHVQSRSYWAPANIGPYSQAIALLSSAEDVERDGLVYIAGQIPLVPASMELPNLETLSSDLSLATTNLNDSASQDTLFTLEAVLSVQHFHRVGQAMSIKTWCPGLVFIVASSNEEAKDRAQVARNIWRQFHQSRRKSTGDGHSEATAAEAFDIWDVTHGSARNYAYHDDSTGNSTEDVVQDVPELHVLCVDMLPRAASIEWVTYGQTRHLQRASIPAHCTHLLDVFRDCIL